MSRSNSYHRQEIQNDVYDASAGVWKTAPYGWDGSSNVQFKVDASGNVKSVITDGTNDAYIWNSGAITCVDEIHYRIKNSKQWAVSHKFEAVADGETAVVHIKTAEKTAHGDYYIVSDGKCWIDFCEAVTLSANADGTALDDFCINRETTASAVTNCFYNPIITDTGNILESAALGTAGKFIGSGGSSEMGLYWYLKPSTSYAIVVTNKSGGNSDIVIGYGWHEHISV